MVARRLAPLAVVVSVLATAAPAGAAERPGRLDTRISYVLGEKIHALAAAPGPRVLAAGGEQAYPGVHGRVRAYLPDGTPDIGFGGDGSIDFAPDIGEVVAMHVYRDGRVLLGMSGSRSRLLVLGSDGSPDVSFGTGGSLDIDFANPNDSLSDVVLLPDGRIVVVGMPANEVAPEKLMHLRRYLPGGAPDPTFGAGGQIEVPSGDMHLFDAVLAHQPGRGVVLFARAYGDGRLRIARVTEAGALDAGFGRGGLAHIEFADPREARRARPSQRSDWRPLVLPDGRVRIPLRIDVPRERPYRMALAGLTAKGHPDIRFGRRGLAIGPRPELPGGESPEHVVRDERGGILVAGSLWSGAEFTGDEAGVVRRFRPNGAPDRSFGRLGLARGAVTGGGYSVIEQRLAFLDADTLVAAEHNYDGKYGFWGPAAIRTLHAGYDRDDPSIELVPGCRAVSVRIRDLSGMDTVTVRADGELIRRTSRKRFRARFPDGTRRVAVKATDLAGNSSVKRARVSSC